MPVLRAIQWQFTKGGLVAAASCPSRVIYRHFHVKL